MVFVKDSQSSKSQIKWKQSTEKTRDKEVSTMNGVKNEKFPENG